MSLNKKHSHIFIYFQVSLYCSHFWLSEIWDNPLWVLANLKLGRWCYRCSAVVNEIKSFHKCGCICWLFALLLSCACFTAVASFLHSHRHTNIIRIYLSLPLAFKVSFALVNLPVEVLHRPHRVYMVAARVTSCCPFLHCSEMSVRETIWNALFFWSRSYFLRSPFVS